MTKKEKESTIKAAKKVSSNMGNVSKKYRDKAPNDKSYFVTVLGINRKFVDSVPSNKQNEIKEKYHIPETIEEGENNYYTIQINGEFYCVRQEGNFALYDQIVAYLPNGDLSRMYLDYPISLGVTNEIFRLHKGVDEPTEDVKENDYWLQLDEAGNALALKIYTNQQWDLICNFAESMSMYFEEEEPLPPEDGSYWVKYGDNNEFIGLYMCDNSSWYQLTARAGVSPGDPTSYQGEYYVVYYIGDNYPSNPFVAAILHSANNNWDMVYSYGSTSITTKCYTSQTEPGAFPNANDVWAEINEYDAITAMHQYKNGEWVKQGDVGSLGDVGDGLQVDSSGVLQLNLGTGLKITNGKLCIDFDSFEPVVNIEHAIVVNKEN